MSQLSTYLLNKYLFGANIYMNLFRCALQVPPTHPRGGHPPHSNLVRGKLTSPTLTLQETGPTVLHPIQEDEAM